MLFSLTYSFGPFSIFYIPHNFVIPQAMQHATPQSYSAFYPHRETHSTLNEKRKGDGLKLIKYFVFYNGMVSLRVLGLP